MSIDRSNEARMLARHLGAITRAIRVHDVGNRAVTRLVEWCARDLSTLAQQHPESKVELDQGVLVINGVVVRMRRDVRIQLVPFSQMLNDVSSGGFRLGGPISGGQLSAFFRGLSVLPKGTSRPDAQKWLDANEAGPLSLLGPRALVAGLATGPGEAVRMAAGQALQAYIRAVLAVQTAREEGTLLRVPPALYRAAQNLAELAEDDPSSHLSLTMLKEDIDYETRHPVHSAMLAMALGRRLGMPRHLLVELGLCTVVAATLPDDPSASDIIGLALDLLQSSRLSVSRARRMLTVFDLRAKQDRTGPPHVVLDAPLHLFARISAVVIDFDALTTTGPGRPGLLADEALARLAADPSGRFDQDLVRIFAATVGRYPLGTAVTLDNGEVGVVLHTPSDPSLATKPLVRLVRDARGREVQPGPLLDLADPAVGRHIVGAVDAASLGIDTRRALFG